MKKQVNITFEDYQASSRTSSAVQEESQSEYELQIRLVERDILTDRECDDMNVMFIEWKEQGKIYWEPEMEDLDLMIQFKLVKQKNYVGSISFVFKDIFEVSKEFSQWLTIFDTLDDDIFDGVLGEDDEEIPRIKVRFEIKESFSDEDAEVTMVKNSNKE